MTFNDLIKTINIFIYNSNTEESNALSSSPVNKGNMRAKLSESVVLLSLVKLSVSTGFLFKLCWYV